MKFQTIADNGRVHIAQKSGHGYRKICSSHHLYHPDKVSLVEVVRIRCSKCFHEVNQAVNWWISFVKAYESSVDPKGPIPAGGKYYCRYNHTYYTKDDFSIILDELIEEIENGRVARRLLDYMLITLIVNSLDVDWGWAEEQWFQDLGVS